MADALTKVDQSRDCRVLVGLSGYEGPSTSLLSVLCIGSLPVTVTTRIITFSVGDPHKHSFTTVTGRGPHPSYVSLCVLMSLGGLQLAYPDGHDCRHLGGTHP